MRFSPGCSCCTPTTPFPSGCSTCPSVPDTLYLTLTMSCGGYSGAVITLSRFPALDGSGTIAYIGTLPTTCGSTSLYQSSSGCDNPYLDHIYVQFQCFLGSPRVTVQLVCASGATYAGGSPDGNQPLTCPGDLSPVNVTVTMGNPAVFSGGCCFGATAPLGTAVITE